MSINALLDASVQEVFVSRNGVVTVEVVAVVAVVVGASIVVTTIVVAVIVIVAGVVIIIAICVVIAIYWGREVVVDTSHSRTASLMLKRCNLTPGGSSCPMHWPLVIRIISQETLLI